MTSPAERYAAAATRFTDLVRAVPADAWDNQSPCKDWTARGVLDHVVATELDFLDQRSLAKPDVSGLPPTEAWHNVRDTVQSVLDDAATAKRSYDGYFGPTTIEETIDRFYTFDLLVHRWDLATAAGLSRHAALHDDELKVIRASIERIPQEVMRTPGLFEPAVEPASDADDTTQMMNFLGRSA